MKRFLSELRALAVALSSLSASAAFAAAEGGLLPEAQQAFERGVAAAEQEGWTMAIHYFTKAQTTEPLSDPILYNLGLAHANAGHEIAGIAWLNAHLASEPDAPNADAIRAEIARLKAAAKDTMRLIFQQAIAAAEQLPEGSSERSYALQRAIPSRYAQAGWIEEAAALSERAGGDEADRQSYLGDYAKSLAEAGDFDGAKAVLNQLPAQVDDGDEAWKILSQSFMQQGKLYAAFEAAARVRAVYIKSDRLMEIAKAAVETGEGALAEEALRLVGKILQQPEEHYISGDLQDFLTGIAAQPVPMDQPILSQVRMMAHRIQKTRYKVDVLIPLGIAQAKAGDLQGARATGTEVLAMIERTAGSTNWDEQVDDEDRIEALALAGKPREAFNLAARLPDLLMSSGAVISPAKMRRAGAFKRLVYLQALAGDLNGARKTMRRAVGFKDAMLQRYLCPEGLAQALLAHGQLEQALEAAWDIEEYRPEQTGGGICSKARTLHSIALQQLKMEDVAASEQTVARIEQLLHEREYLTSYLSLDDLSLALVRAYQRHGRSEDALRRLNTLRRTLDAKSDRYRSEGSQESIRKHQVEVLASLGQLVVAEWIGLARLISAYDPQEALLNATQPSDGNAESVMRAIADVAGRMGHFLLRIQTLERASPPPH